MAPHTTEPSPGRYYKWSRTEKEYEQSFKNYISKHRRFQQAGFTLEEIKDIIWSAVNSFMEQTYYANPRLQPQRRDIPTELHLPWLVARPDERPEDANEDNPVDIFIRPLKLRVHWADTSPGLSQQHMRQPVIAGIGNDKANGVVMGPRFLKALITDQLRATTTPTMSGWAGGSTSLGNITEQAQFAEAHGLHGYTVHWDANFDMCHTVHQIPAIQASLLQAHHQSMPPALKNPSGNPTAQPASARWVEFNFEDAETSARTRS